MTSTPDTPSTRTPHLRTRNTTPALQRHDPHLDSAAIALAGGVTVGTNYLTGDAMVPFQAVNLYETACLYSANHATAHCGRIIGIDPSKHSFYVEGYVARPFHTD